MHVFVRVRHVRTVIHKPPHNQQNPTTHLGELGEALLARPHRGVDDLEEELAGAGVEDEDGAVDGLGRQVACGVCVGAGGVSESVGWWMGF
jgi:hypothetical protein